MTQHIAWNCHWNINKVIISMSFIHNIHSPFIPVINLVLREILIETDQNFYLRVLYSLILIYTVKESADYRCSLHLYKQYNHLKSSNNMRFVNH